MNFKKGKVGKMNNRKCFKRGEMYYILGNETVGHEQIANGRPGIIVSNDTANIYSGTIEVIYLTTAEKTSLPTHVKINSSPKPSTALCEQITSVAVERIMDPCGKITDLETKELNRAIAISVGIETNDKDCIDNGIDDGIDNATKQLDVKYVEELELLNDEYAKKLDVLNGKHIEEIEILQKNISRAEVERDVFKSLYTDELQKNNEMEKKRILEDIKRHYEQK